MGVSFSFWLLFGDDKEEREEERVVRRLDVDGLGVRRGKFEATDEMTVLSLPVVPMIRGPVNVYLSLKFEGRKISSITGV